MKNKTRKPVKGILVTGEMIPITDPKEQAEVDRLFRLADERLAVQKANARKAKARKAK